MRKQFLVVMIGILAAHPMTLEGMQKVSQSFKSKMPKKLTLDQKTSFPKKNAEIASPLIKSPQKVEISKRTQSMIAGKDRASLLMKSKIVSASKKLERIMSAAQKKPEKDSHLLERDIEGITPRIEEKILEDIRKWKAVPGPVAENLFIKDVPFQRSNVVPLKKTSFADIKFKHTKQSGIKGVFGSPTFGRLPRSQAHPFAQRAYSQKIEKFDYRLNGTNAKMDPEKFVDELGKLGLTVADVMYKTCQEEVQPVYAEMRALGLDDKDFKLLANITQMRNTALKGHYDENNITFEEGIDATIITMIKDVFQKANMPFKITIKLNHPYKSIAALGTNSQDVHRGLVEEKFDWDRYASSENSTNLHSELYLGSRFFSLEAEVQKFALAHETIHLINLHTASEYFFRVYLEKIKGIKDTTRITQLISLIEKIQEYQADLLPLVFRDYAEGALEFSKFFIFKLMLRSDKYISYEKLLDLAERALELHDAEYKIWQSKNNQPSYVDAIEDEPELFNESVRKVVKKNSSWWWPW